MNLEIVPVISIVVICYIVGLLLKTVPDERVHKWIPVAVGISGAILGVAGLMTVEGFPASDWMNAVEIGIVSGLASTGVNQVYKQFTK